MAKVKLEWNYPNFEYKLIMVTNLLDLELEINSHLKEGWQLYGDLILSANMSFIQPMVRLIKEKNEQQVEKD